MTSPLRDELKAFETLAENFALKELSPRREESDRYPFGPFPDDILEKAYEVGFLGITLPEELGGIGQGISALCNVLERICRADASLGAVIFTNTLSQEIIMRAGGSDILGRILSSPADAKGFLIAFPSYSNPAEHSGLPAAKKGANGYALSGKVDYAVLGNLASHALVPARTSGLDGYSLFLISLNDPRVRKSEPVFSLGVHACPACDLVLSNAEATLIGGEDRGKDPYEDASDFMNAAAAAMSLGVMRGSFDYALAYCNEREQGGWPIVNWSEIKMILSSMAVQVEVAGMAVSEACCAIENKVSNGKTLARAAALFVQDAACLLTTDGIQVLGGYGYMKDYGQEKRFRDAKQLQALLGLSPLRKLRFMDQINAKA
ncbi:MAG TPA: acyl-CoA dehydrogenase family protein [Deltaproteobacteria bacterium]|jgi:alkylation response protein AidB-like acyl-CoA dehydrogenase|nr:acyl-CoA dehydrogenase family protein [Deltaproteobacteria bacterium]HQJ08765.1 acyl-CoA dehydrogenase family protein [Deltaproteobacteria bacterium]